MTAPRRFRFDIRESGRAILGVFVALLALNILAAVLFVRPARNELSRLGDDNQPQVKRLRAREREVTDREAYVNALRQANTDIQRLRDDVLSTRELRLIEVQAELAIMAAEFGINLKRIQWENTFLPEYGVERFATVVPLEGGYANLRKFIQAVETSKRYLLIDRVALAQGQDGGALLQLNITLATYFMVPPPPPPADARGPARST